MPFPTLEATTEPAEGKFTLPVLHSAPWIRKGILAVLDQGLIAGSNFFVGILLARWLAPEQYGAYALAFSIFLLFFQLYHSFVLEPMSVFGGSEYRDCLRGYLRQLLWIHLAIALLVCFVLGLSACLAHLVQSSGGLAGALAGATIAGPCVLLLWLARGTFYVRVAPKAAACGAILYCATLLAGLFLLFHQGWLSPFTAFLLMGLSALLTSALLLAQLRQSLPRNKATPDLKSIWRQHWRYGRWALGSSVATWVPSNICYAAVSGFFGIASAGELKALLNLALPVGHTATALSLLLQSHAARIHLQEGTVGIRSLTRRMTQLLSAGALFYWAGLVFFSHQAVHLLYGGNYEAIAHLMPWLALASVLQVAICGPGIGLRAMGSPASVFLAYLASSTISVLVGIPLIWKLGVPGVIVAMILSNFLAMMVAFSLLRRKERGGALLLVRTS
jgi:O-antigen/teichoic acid export membrane protein